MELLSTSFLPGDGGNNDDNDDDYEECDRQDYDGDEGVYVAGGFAPDKHFVPFDAAITCARQKELNAMEDAAKLLKVVSGTVVHVPSIVVAPIVGTQDSSLLCPTALHSNITCYPPEQQAE